MGAVIDFSYGSSNGNLEMCLWDMDFLMDFPDCIVGYGFFFGFCSADTGNRFSVWIFLTIDCERKKWIHCLDLLTVWPGTRTWFVKTTELLLGEFPAHLAFFAIRKVCHNMLYQIDTHSYGAQVSVVPFGCSR